MTTLKTTALLAALALATAGGEAAAVSFLINDDTASPGNRQGFDPSQDVYRLDLRDFPVNGPLSLFQGAAGDPGIASWSDNPNTIGTLDNIIILQNFDNNDVDGNFPANWDNSFNARRALEAIAANTTGNRPGFFLYWNEGLGINRLVYTENLANGAAPFRVLFANDEPGAEPGDDLRIGPGGVLGLGGFTPERGQANAAFNDLANFSSANFTTVVPVPATLPLILAGMAGLGLLGHRRRAAA
ncbi:MAG: VPLPA-CTERM sorting domain-containing protein [Pseudomonadota bacterium]